MYKDEITKEALQECIDQGMTQTAMAIRFNTSFQTIKRLIKQYGLKPAYTSDTGRYDQKKMERCLQQGMTVKEIAKVFSVGESTVSKWRKKYNLNIPAAQKTPRPRKKMDTDCKTCIYRVRNKDMPYECDYYSMTGHTRNMGQPEEACSKYEKGKRGRKRGKRKV